MAKLKNRAKRKKAKIKKANLERQAKYESGDFVQQFKGYIQISLREETDDAAVKEGVIKVGVWNRKGYQIFKHSRYFLVQLTLVSYIPGVEDAEMEAVTTEKVYRSEIVGVARMMADELIESQDVIKYEEIDFNSSYLRIFV